jgi:hypothetical protein
MHTRTVADPVFLLEFVLVKAREVWPSAVMLSPSGDEYRCSYTRRPDSSYGYDIFPSAEVIAEWFDSDLAQPPSVNVCCASGAVQVRGAPDVVAHILSSPLWISQ